MPFIPNTPESLIARSDSKNPETTCRGITSSGRPCRRSLGACPSASPAVSRLGVKKLRNDDPSDPNLYCWQHKDQASLSARSSPGPGTRTTPILETRESLDTLFDRLGIVEAQQKKSERKGRHSGASKQTGGQGTERITQQGQSHIISRPPQRNSKTQQKVSFCCFFTIPVAEGEQQPARPKPRPLQSAPTVAPSAKLPSTQHLAPSSAGPRPAVRPGMVGSGSMRRSSAFSATSQTSQYLSLIPPTASPQTASQLMAELAKPVSQQDEAGYIYIFWLTPESQPVTPPAEAARSLLSPPARPETRHRRASDVIETFAAKATNSTKKTMLLKIGRASNVQRRLNEWSRQCGYNLSLIRYYPYVSSNQPSTPRKVPHSHKVERLVHLELAGAGLRVSDKGVCDVCGKAHREWFEIDASRKGIMMVDEVVRRWSDWSESSF